jgi:hypothetical protein
MKFPLPVRLRRRPADHWDHPGQVEERSRNGRFLPEAEQKIRTSLIEGIRQGNPGRPDDAGAPDLTASWARLPAEAPQFLPAPAATVPAAPAARSPMEAIGEAYSSLAPAARNLVDEALAGGAAHPYGQPRAAWEDAYRRVVAREWTAPQVEFHPVPFAAPDTAPMDAVRADVPPPPAVRATALPRRRQVADDHPRELGDDGADQDEAPFHDALLKAWHAPFGDPRRPAWRPPARRARRHDAAVARRAGDVRDLAYPEVTGFTAPGADDVYAGLLRRASAITGTPGIGNWPHPALGGAA